MKKVLLTGFEPFGGEKINPSQEVATRLNGAVIARHEIVGVVLPCEFGRAIRELKRHLKQHDPALVICLGQAGGREGITPERVAINVDDARIKDNAGAQPIDRAVVRGGPAAYWSTLPIKAIVQSLQSEGIPSAVSQTAGTFVCNHVFYGLMHTLRDQRTVRGGFIHVPWMSGQGSPCLSIDQITTGIRLAIEVSLNRRRDLKAVGGQTH